MRNAADGLCYFWQKALVSLVNPRIRMRMLRFRRSIYEAQILFGRKLLMTGTRFVETASAAN